MEYAMFHAYQFFLKYLRIVQNRETAELTQTNNYTLFDLLRLSCLSKAKYNGNKIEIIV